MVVDQLCIRCRGRGYCGMPCKILSKIKKSQPKIKTEFSGSSPPEIFVGRSDYPHVYSGILAPDVIGNTENMSMPEKWYENQDDIEKILSYRAGMVYSRFKIKVKNPKLNSANSIQSKKFLGLLQDVAIASKPIDASFELKRQPSSKFSLTNHTPLIGNPAPLKKAMLESNLHVEKKVDYLVNDIDAKSVDSMRELFKSSIPVSNIIKILSAGLLGLKKQRRMVPTRWAVTATDDALSKDLLKKIRYFSQISEILLFNGNYLGNYYEILFLPGEWGFEVLEMAETGGVWNPESTAIWHDYEFFGGRKDYASSVTGGYYSVRLPITEYLDKIKRQATIIIFREVRKEYWAPCGVGILRELMRGILKQQPERFSTIQEAFARMQTRFKSPIQNYTRKSILLKRKKEQKKLFDF